MPSALVGYSGFVGSTLLAQASFDDLYRSTNIDEIDRREYDLLICAGAPAAKWKANQAPGEDLANLRRLMEHLARVQVGVAVLISTVDVYPAPVKVYEDTRIDPETSAAYGRHRLYLEEFFTNCFARVFTIRLPGLFGRGLRKNFIFDLLRNPGSLPMTHHESVFQFYDMSRLWADVQRVIAARVSLINFATPPVAAREVALRCFGVEFTNVAPSGPVHYDVRTRHASIFGRSGDYIASQEEVLEQIARFVEKERACSNT